MSVYWLKNRDGNWLRVEGRGESETEARVLAGIGQWTAVWPVEVWTGEERAGASRWTLTEHVPRGTPASTPEQRVSLVEAVWDVPIEPSRRQLAERVVYRVLPGSRGGWDLTKDGELVAHEETKAAAVHLGASLAREIHGAGGLSQLVIHRKNGEFESERTYGDDPEESEG